MKNSARHTRTWIVRKATETPRRAAVTRYLLSIGVVVAVFTVVPYTPLDGPVGGVLALSSVVVCCWFSGVGPALLMPLTVWVVSRFPFDAPVQSLLPSAQELLTFLGLTMLTGAVGLAGQFRYRLKTATRHHDARLREQRRALSAARIIFRDVEGRITTWTMGAEQLYGWTSDEAAGCLIHDLLRTEFPVPLDTIREELLREGQWRGEVTQTSKRGEKLNVAIHGILYSGENNGRRGVAEVHSDVTALRLAEAAIRESDRQKDLFIATLAHELRNPLAPLRSGLDVLRMMHADSHDDQSVLEIMQRQLEHMVRMIDDLLDVSRINTGKVELRRAPVKLADIIHDAVATCRPQIEEAQHTLQVSLPAENIILLADAARFVQVLTNLLSNAIKFTDAGGDVGLSAVRNGDQVTVCVRDSGAGIPTELLPHIFDMFVQVQDPHYRSSNGLGLGLHIVRNIVELHGGTVEARSDGPGRGSEFLIRLPVLTHHAPIGGERQPTRFAQNGRPASQRVLIVDDNRDAARTLTLMLSHIGFECRAAFDGPSALVAAEEFDPQAVVLDLGMPGMDGLEVARRFRANPDNGGLLLIAVTGWDKLEDRRKSREAGFDHHLAKPVPFDRLCELLGHGTTTPMAAAPPAAVTAAPVTDRH
jgi:PAS domain S-box-containing protein